MDDLDDGDHFCGECMKIIMDVDTTWIEGEPHCLECAEEARSGNEGGDA